MIPRHITQELNQVLLEYPIVTILGPRQAGKTTLARSFCSDFQYSNLEIPEIRHFAQDDPKGYLSQFRQPVIIDEIQRVPELLSYLQAIVDEKKQNGLFILTGSHQLALKAAVTQSLAGRTAILNLLPFSMAELQDAMVTVQAVDDLIYKGFFPRIYDQNQRPGTAYSNYYQTYIERDVSQLIQLKDKTLFETFIKLLAGRVGQLMDYHSLANDVGVSSKTIKHWLSILEASFLIYKLQPYYKNLGKRLIKAPKYYFIDTGLLCFLLGIEEPHQVARDPLIGQLFENLVVIDFLKMQMNLGKLPTLYFYRDSNGNEVDIIIERGRQLISVEIKYGSTYHPSLLKNLKKFSRLSDNIERSCLVYNGAPLMGSDGIQAINFQQSRSIFNQ